MKTILRCGFPMVVLMAALVPVDRQALATNITLNQPFQAGDYCLVDGGGGNFYQFRPGNPSGSQIITKITNSGDLTFLGGNGQLYFANTQYRTQLLANGDTSLGTLMTPIPALAQVTYYAVLDKGDTASNYVNAPLLVYGWYGVVGATTISSSSFQNDGGTNNFYSINNIAVQGGDSGSPSFIPYGGQLTLAGTRWYTYSGYSGDAAWDNPYVVAQTNAEMGPDGCAIKVIAVPTKNWSGNASSGDFSIESNWTQGAAPSKEGIAFDAAGANGQYNINISATPSIKGITFTPTAGSGFVFTGLPMQLGTGGLINNSPQTQTFNNDIQMTYSIDANTTTGAQHWSANNGNVANNGFQLVVDGVHNTTINGSISGLPGVGGLGKDGSGKLTLANANTYSGNTTVFNGTLAVNNNPASGGSGTGQGNVVVWGGTLAGKGSIAGSVLVRSGGVLAPGNADGSETGILTVGEGVRFFSGAHLAVHLNGLSPGNEFDQLLVTGGNVDLGNATLNVYFDHYTAMPWLSSGSSMIPAAVSCLTSLPAWLTGRRWPPSPGRFFPSTTTRIMPAVCWPAATTWSC